MGKLLCRDGMLRLAANVRERPEQWLSRLIFLLGPWVSFWMVEILNGNDVFSDLYSWQVLMNLIWYYLLFLLCRLILGRRRRAAATAAGLSFFVGIVNHYVLRFRGRILFPADLTAWETAANVADAFDFSLDAAIRQGAARPTNIIVVMNESFADLTIFEGLEVSEDPTPFLHSMKENTVRGWMYSPVTGGGTASVEFEYLTGFSTIFQPPHTVAYQLYAEEGMPSLAALAGSVGYDSTAFHPYKSSGWNRPIVYEDMRFDHQLYEEDVTDPYLIRRYVSDQSDYETLYSITDRAEGDPAFIFNVTMQNHSSYAQGWNNLEKTITLPTEQRTADTTAEQYLSLMRASDDALRDLIAHYEQSPEPTMIVFFGDHQPPLKNAFYEQLYGKPLDQRTTEEVLKQYATPFFLWTNYDIQEREDVVLSPNYLGVLTAKAAGLPLTGFMSFLSQLYEELPVITPVGIITGDGQAVKREELTEEQQEWLMAYETLNYCGIVDLDDEVRPMFCLD